MRRRELLRSAGATSGTSANAMTSVTCTSLIDSSIGTERSNWTDSSTDGGSCAWSVGSNSLTCLATSTVFAPGWRWTPRTTARGISPGEPSGLRSVNHAASLSF